MSKSDVTLTAHVDQTEVDQTIRKAERLAELLKEARSLAGELASMEIPIEVMDVEQSFDVAKTINATAKAKGLYQKFVAEQSGFTEQQFSDMLNGRKVIRAEYLPKIANALGVSVGDLFVDTEQSSA